MAGIETGWHFYHALPSSHRAHADALNLFLLWLSNSIKVLLLTRKAVNGSHPTYPKDLISIYECRLQNPGQSDLELCRKSS